MVPERRGAGKPFDRMLRVDRRLAFDEREFFGHATGPGLGFDGQHEPGLAGLLVVGNERPRGVGRFAVRRMLFAVKRFGVAAERHTKEIAAKYA